LLDLLHLAAQIDEMIGESEEKKRKYSSLINHALELLHEFDKRPDLWIQKINSDNRHFFVAFPQGNITDTHSLPQSYAHHTVIAVDGSQIDVDTHEVALCYVLNAGKIVIHYGTGDPPFLSTFSKLFFKEEDLYMQGEYESHLVQGESLAEIRQMFEADQLRQLILAHRKADIPTVALVDGRLVSWDRRGTARKDPAAFTAPYYEDVFKTGQLSGLPVAGYISGSRTSLVVNTLRAKGCVKSVMKCSGCEFKGDKSADCNLIEGVKDTSIFASLLNTGERTCHFYGGINSLTSQDAPRYRIGFFYINVGSEIARVEAPDYVLDNPMLLDLLHSVVFDQAQKGMGYPIALQEAHHFAVVKGEDRVRFFELLRRQLANSGFELKVTNKKIGKTSRIF